MVPDQAEGKLSLKGRQPMSDQNDRDDIPQPAEDPETGSTGTTDERSSENRRKGLEREPDDKLGEADDK